ncbi:hypothetical protein Tco_0078679 [Tanacetum coccineum]
MPSIPSPKLVISCFDDLDFFKDFENEFPAIVYNDAQTSKLELLTEPTLIPQHIDEFNLNDETSVSEYDEEEQNILYFNDLFPFNIIRLNDLKSENDNDDNDTDIIQYSEDIALPPRELRRPFLRYEGLQYTKAGLPDLMAKGLSGRMIMEHRDAHGVRISSAGDFLGTTPSYTAIRDPILRLCHRLIACSIVGRSQAPEKVTMTDLFYLRGMDVGSVNFPYLLAKYLRLFVAGRKSGAHISGGQFVARLAKHFGLLTAEILEGLTVIAPELLIIDMGKLVRLQICIEVDDIWAWVTMGLERQPDAAAGAPRVAQDAPIVNEGVRHLYRHHHHHQLLPEPCLRGWFSTWVITGLARMMDRARVAYMPYSETHVPYQRRRVRIKPGSKFSTIVHEYDTELSRIFTLNARMGKRDDFKCVKAEDKSNLKTLK